MAKQLFIQLMTPRYSQKGLERGDWEEVQKLAEAFAKTVDDYHYSAAYITSFLVEYRNPHEVIANALRLSSSSKNSILRIRATPTMLDFTSGLEGCATTSGLLFEERIGRSICLSDNQYRSSEVYVKKKQDRLVSLERTVAHIFQVPALLNSSRVPFALPAICQYL